MTIKIFKKLAVILLLASFAVAGLDLSAQAAERAQSPSIGITFGTGPTGGGFYIVGAAMGNVIRSHTNLKVTTQTTGGSNANVAMLNKGEINVGLAALSAEDVLKAVPNAMLLYAGYVNVQYFVIAKDTASKNLMDLKGKKISVPLPSEGGFPATKMVFESLGLTFNDFRTSFLSTSESPAAFRDGKVEMVTMIAGIPQAAFMDLPDAPRGMKLLSLTDEQIAKIVKKYPNFSPAIVPSGTYKDQNYDSKTVGLWARILTTRNLPEDAGYWIAKALHENFKELVSATATAKGSTAANTIFLETERLKMHPGVAKYFRERGLLK